MSAALSAICRLPFLPFILKKKRQEIKIEGHRIVWSRKELNLAFLITSTISFFLEIRTFTLLILYRCALLFYNVMYLLEINIL